MEWTLPVNEILADEITKINYNLMPPQYQGNIQAIRLMQESLSKIINIIGEQSAAAQGLNRIITNAEKLRNSPTHTLYLLNDKKARGFKGEVIGLLKVGRKHLFLFNENNQVCEVEPVCVLDFFVLNDRQRAGYGKILFDYMLEDVNVTAKHLAIDGPSNKMEQFLRKNYGIDVLMRQNNNFAVSPEFFKLVPDIRKARITTPVEAPIVGRFAAAKPQSAIATVIHGTQVSCYEGDNSNWYETAAAQPTAERGSPRMEIPSAPPAEPETWEPTAEPEPAPAVVEEAVANNTKSPERPSTLSVEPVAEAGVVIPAVSPAGSTMSRRDSQLTDQGYFDVKFYHNKLW